MMDPSLPKNALSPLWSRKGGDQKRGPSFWVLWTPPIPQRDSISCFLSPQNFTCLWVSLGDIHIASPGSKSLSASCWHCRDYESHKSWVWPGGFQFTTIAQQIKWRAPQECSRLLLTNKSSLSSLTKLCCTSHGTDYCVPIGVSTVSPELLRGSVCSPK